MNGGDKDKGRDRLTKLSASSRRTNAEENPRMKQIQKKAARSQPERLLVMLTLLSLLVSLTLPRR
jgi:hypothetical protein